MFFNDTATTEIYTLSLHDALPISGGDGRVHASFNQTGAATGRLSSSNPNLQNIPIRTEGDCLARYFVRMEEMLESVKIIRQCLDRLPDGPIRTDDAKKSYPSKNEVYYSMEGMIHDFVYTFEGITPPKGAHSYHAVEAPKGELGFYITSDGTGHPWRVRMKAPSFAHLQGLAYMLEGSVIGDMVVLIGTIDPVMGESDK